MFPLSDFPFFGGRAFPYILFFSNQNFELGDRLNEKEFRLKVKVNRSTGNYSFDFFWRLDSLLSLGERGCNSHPWRGSCRIPWEDQPSGGQKRQVDKLLQYDILRILIFIGFVSTDQELSVLTIKTQFFSQRIRKRGHLKPRDWASQSSPGGDTFCKQDNKNQ